MWRRFSWGEGLTTYVPEARRKAVNQLLKKLSRIWLALKITHFTPVHFCFLPLHFAVIAAQVRLGSRNIRHISIDILFIQVTLIMKIYRFQIVQE